MAMPPQGFKAVAASIARQKGVPIGAASGLLAATRRKRGPRKLRVRLRKFH